MCAVTRLIQRQHLIFGALGNTNVCCVMESVGIDTWWRSQLLKNEKLNKQRVLSASQYNLFITDRISLTSRSTEILTSHHGATSRRILAGVKTPSGSEQRCGLRTDITKVGICTRGRNQGIDREIFRLVCKRMKIHTYDQPKESVDLNDLRPTTAISWTRRNEVNAREKVETTPN